MDTARRYLEYLRLSYQTLLLQPFYENLTTKEKAELFYYRTRSGLEVDLIIKIPYGIIGLEVKNKTLIVKKDYRAMC